jgi:hypothetical protein
MGEKSGSANLGKKGTKRRASRPGWGSTGRRHKKTQAGARVQYGLGASSGAVIRQNQDFQDCQDERIPLEDPVNLFIQ